MDTISRQHPYTGIMILSDFNRLPDDQIRTYQLRQSGAETKSKSASLDKIFSNIVDWFEPPAILPAILNLIMILL